MEGGLLSMQLNCMPYVHVYEPQEQQMGRIVDVEEPFVELDVFFRLAPVIKNQREHTGDGDPQRGQKAMRSRADREL